MNDKKEIKIGKDFASLVTGFVLGFLIAFAICWNTISYIIRVAMER